jgi:tetratricopeptide (TPR) repeat protein
MIAKNREPRTENLMTRMILRFLVLGSWFFIVSGCAFPGTEADTSPPPTPTPVLAPYNNAIATAEAGGDTKAQAQAYYERGNIQLDQGDHQAAIADYTKALALDPTNARAFNNRALAFVALGEGERALADYAAAIKADPGYVRAYQNRLHLLEQRGDLKGMAADYDRLAQLDSKNVADYRYRQGSALHGLRDFAGARKAYDAALTTDPQHVDALYERALLSFAEGHPDAAIGDLDRALRLSPRAANAFYARGQAHAAMGDQTTAVKDFTAALNLQADYPDALLARAAAYHAAGQDSRARTDLDTAERMQLDETLRSAADALREQLDDS